MKNSLFEEIRNFQDQRVGKTREISKIQSKIRKLDNEYKENLLKFNVEEEEMRQDLEKQRIATAAVEAEYKEIKALLEVAQISEGKASIKLKRINEILQDMRIEDQALESEIAEQQIVLNDLKTSAKEKVPIKIVKESLCKLCLMKISFTNAVMFKNVLPTVEEKKPHSQKPEEINRQICSCEIY